MEWPLANTRGVDELLIRLGRRIRDLRSQKGWSQEEFASVCRVHRTYMGHLERGEKNVSFSSLVRVAGALNVSLSELLKGLENRSGEDLPSPKKRAKPGEIDRNRIVAVLAMLERAIAELQQTMQD